MPIWPRPLINRAASLAVESCIELIMIGNRVEARNGIDAIAFVAPKTAVGDGGRPNRCAFWGGEFMQDWWWC